MRDLLPQHPPTFAPADPGTIKFAYAMACTKMFDAPHIRSQLPRKTDAISGTVGTACWQPADDGSWYMPASAKVPPDSSVVVQRGALHDMPTVVPRTARSRCSETAVQRDAARATKPPCTAGGRASCERPGFAVNLADLAAAGALHERRASS